MNDAVIESTNEPAIRTALGTLLIEAGFLDGERLEEALRIGSDTGERLGEVVVRMGWASEDDLAKTLAAQWHLRYVERSAISFDGDALSRMSREEATRLEALPMQVSADGAIVVALAEPTDARLLALRSLLGDRIDCVVVAKTAIDAGLRSGLLPNGGSTTFAVVEVVEVAEIAKVEDVAEDVVSDDGEHDSGLFLVAPEPIDSADEPTASRFDEVAKMLSEGLSAQLASLRAIVVDAESTRQRDGVEIARLTAELGDRTTELNDRTTELSDLSAELAGRNETIQTMQHKLRELADTLELNS